MTKKMIKAKVKSGYAVVSIDPYILDGSFDKAISYLQEMKEDYDGRNVELCYEESYDNNNAIFLYEHRLETDEEYKKRLEEEERLLEYKREQLERLKKELGK